MMPTRDDDFDAENNNFAGMNSNDGINNNNSQSSRLSQNATGLSKAELRKSNKPIMEKRRRARINQSLNKMKSLMLEAMKKDPARHTKLEKADILEMTVKYLQSVQRQQLSMAIQTDPTVIHKFKAGFTECAEEVMRYVSTLEGVDTGVRTRLANHLNSCATNLEQIGNFNSFTAGYRSNASVFSKQFSPAASTNTPFPLPQDVNNNGRIQMGGVQLIPSRLPSGEIALIMPNSTNLPFFPGGIPTTQNLDFASAFSRVSAFSKPGLPGCHRSSTHTTTVSSPPLSPISSISSCGDDSMHNSSDFQMKTPPLSHSLNSSFETPPSAESYSRKFACLTGHLQQQHVSSTSEMQKDALKETLKRIRPDEDCFDEVTKKIKVESRTNNKNLTKETQNAVEGNSDMWRPW